MYDNEFKAKGNKIQTKDKIDHNVCIQEISPGSDKIVRPSVHPPTPLCCVSLCEMPHVLARSLRRIYQISVFSGGWWWLGGGGCSTTTKFSTGRLRTQVQPLPLSLYTIFDREGIPFVYLLLTNESPLTYLV